MHIQRYLLAVLAALALLTTWAASASAQGKKKIAVLGLEVLDAGGGIDAKTTQLANQITDALRQRARQQVGSYVLAPHSEKDLLEMKLLSGCNDEAEACMAAIGKDLEADTLLYGKIQKLSDGYQVSLTILDVKTKTKQAMTARLSIKEAQADKEIAKWSKKNYDRVTGVPQEGTLVVKANVDSGTVFVEGDVKGTLVGGTARISGLTAGKVNVAIESPGHKRYTVEVEIKVGEPVSIDAQLEAGAMISVGGPEGPSDKGGGKPGRIWRIATWGLVAASAASGVYWGLSYKQIRDAKDDLEALPGLPMTGGKVDCKMVTTPTEAVAACENGNDAANRTKWLIPLTIATGAAAIVTFYLGYLSGDSPSSKEQTNRSRRSRERNVQVAPVVTPTYTGGAVVIEF